MINFFQNLFFHIVDLLFPSYCINCAAATSYKDACLCGNCIEKIELLENKCEICSGAIFENKCVICSGRKIYFDKNITVAGYSGIVKEILHNYKFNKRKRLCKHISKLAIKEIIQYKNIIDIITSVPINRKKRFDRGFNQSELIAKDIAKKLNKVYLSCLKEKYHFKTQRKLGFRDRFLNILDRYEVQNAKRNKKYIQDKKVLIIDDVFTTGATINECARILKSFGADRVYSLTIARADIKRVDKFSI
jgi:competence protein ComFC